MHLLNITAALLFLMKVGESLVCYQCKFNPRFPSKGCNGSDETDANFIDDCSEDQEYCYASSTTITSRSDPSDGTLVSARTTEVERGCSVEKRTGCDEQIMKGLHVYTCYKYCGTDGCNNYHELVVTPQPLQNESGTTTSDGTNIEANIAFFLFLLIMTRLL